MVIPRSDFTHCSYRTVVYRCTGARVDLVVRVERVTTVRRADESWQGVYLCVGVTTVYDRVQ